MVPTLFVFGDSFSLDIGNKIKIETWPELLSKKLNKKLVNLSIPGASNELILDTVLDTLKDIKQEDTVIFGVTHPLRLDFYDWEVEETYLLSPMVISKIVNKNFKNFSEDNILKKNKSVRKDTVNYYLNIYTKAEHANFDRAINRFESIQKYLLNIRVNSLIWSWYNPKVFDPYGTNRINTPSKFQRINDVEKNNDYHFSEIGHKEFSIQLYSKLEDRQLNWLNIEL